MNKFFLFALIISFIACGDDSQDEAGTTVLTSSSASRDTIHQKKDFFYSLPSPLIMAKVFKRTGLQYVEGIANAPDNAAKYSSVQSKSLNLGIYSTDLAYTVLNQQTQQASKYLNAIKKLSDELEMSTVFDADNYLTRFRNNINNEDSIFHIVAQLKSEMDFFMKDNEKEKLSLMIFIGSWVENMYIATQLTQETQKGKIVQHIAEQKYILNNLMNVLSDLQNDNDFNPFYLKLNNLKALFDNLSVQGEKQKLVMDERQLKAITEKTRDIRKDIVG